MFHLSRDLKVDEGVEVRLYKRGYRTFQVSRAYQGSDLRLTPAKSMNERESAIDTLFGPDVAGSASTQPADASPVVFTAEEVFHFQPSPSSAFSAACDFGTEEYAELLPDLPAPDRDRVEAKVHVLHWLASRK